MTKAGRVSGARGTACKGGRPGCPRTRLAVTAAVGLLVTGLAAAELPPHDCLVTLRSARIAFETGRHDEAWSMAQAASRLERCELPALSQLLLLQALHPKPEHDPATLRERLVSRLSDPASDLPPGTLVFLASLPGSSELDAALLAALERRLTTLDAEGRSPSGLELDRFLTLRLSLEQRLGRLEAARATVGRLLAERPHELWRWRAIQLDAALGRWDDLARSIEALPPDSDLSSLADDLYLLALARLGRHEELLARIDSRVASPDAPAPPLDREGRPAYLSLLDDVGWALRDQGRDAEAESVFRRALAIEPGLESVERTVLALYARPEERAALETTASTASGDEAPSAESLYERGTQLLAAGDAATALDLLARAAPGLGGSTFEPAAWYNLGLAAFKLENWSEAARAFGEAARLEPERGETHYQRGLALFHLDRCREAVQALDRAVELRPERYQAHYYLARCHAALGDAGASSRETELYRRLKPPG